MNKGEKRVTDSGIGQHVYVWQRKLIFRAYFVKVMKVYVVADLTIFLINWDNVC